MRTLLDYDPAGDTQKSVDAIVDEIRSAYPRFPSTRRSLKATLQGRW